MSVPFAMSTLLDVPLVDTRDPVTWVVALVALAIVVGASFLLFRASRKKGRKRDRA